MMQLVKRTCSWSACCSSDLHSARHHSPWLRRRGPAPHRRCLAAAPGAPVQQVSTHVHVRGHPAVSHCLLHHAMSTARCANCSCVLSRHSPGEAWSKAQRELQLTLMVSEHRRFASSSSSTSSTDCGTQCSEQEAWQTKLTVDAPVLAASATWPCLSTQA